MSSKPAPKATEEEKLNWEVEKLRNEVRNLGRTFIFAIVTAILALAATTYQIYDKVSNLRIQQYERDKLQYERDKLQGDIDDLKKRKQELAVQWEVATSKFNQYSLSLEALVKNTSLTDKERIEQLQQISPAFQFSAPDTKETNLPARIYLQYLDSQSTKIDSVVRQLKDLNYTVTPLANAKSGRRRGASVSYYYTEDEEEAVKLVTFLKAMNIPNVDEKPTKLSGAARPDTLTYGLRTHEVKYVHQGFALKDDWAYVFGFAAEAPQNHF